MLGKRLINSNDTGGACASDEVDILGDGSGVALYQLNWDGSDMSGNYDGTATDVSFVNGKIDSAGSFNGSSSKVVSNVPKSSAQSFSFWTKYSTQSNTTPHLLGYSSTGSNGFFGLQISSGVNLSIIYWNGSTYARNTSSINIADNNWHHIVLTTNGNAFNIYIDGNTTPAYTTNLSGFTHASRSDFQISYENPDGANSYFDGDIDQVRIFNKALSASEVTTLYNETACVKTCTTDTPQLVPDCIAYYKLDGNADDSNGTATVYDGTPTNVSWTQGRLGSAAGFNGSSSYIDLGSSINTTYVTPTGSFSASSWVNFKTVDSSPQQIINFDTFDNIEIALNGVSQGVGKIVVSIWTGSYVHLISTTTVVENNWYHITVTHNNGSWALYVNGTIEDTGTKTLTQPTDNVVLGKRQNNSQYLNGKLDQVRIYDRAITAAEVTTLYNEVACPSGASFNTVLWTGDGSADRAIGGVGFQPDFVWIKSRDDGTHWHDLFDSVRGAGERLFSNTTSAESYYSESLKSFNTDGFTIGIDTDVNANGDDTVAWCWKAGGDAVTIPQGTVGNTIASDVSANVDAGFSIVKYTTNYNGSNNVRVGHGLSQTPQIIIQKPTSTTGDWLFTNNIISGTTDWEYLVLNSTAAQTTSFTFFDGINAPDSTTFRDGNTNGTEIIAYCFHSVAGYQKIGSYTGNGSTTGPIVYTTDNGLVGGANGFKPRFIMTKGVAGDRWLIADTVRHEDLNNNAFLDPSDSHVESDFGSGNGITFLSNGFQPVSTDNLINGSGREYIYLAIA